MNIMKKTLLTWLIMFSPVVIFSMQEGKYDTKGKISYLDKIIRTSYTCYLQYESDPEILYPVVWGLENCNEKLNISVFSGFNEQNKQKALLIAVQHFYLQLAKNKFDVSFLEKVMLGNYECRDIKLITPHNQHIRFTKSDFCINDAYCQRVTMTKALLAKDNRVTLKVQSSILPELEEDDSIKYQENLNNFAGALLAPVVNVENGARNVNLSGLNDMIVELGKRYNLMQIEQEGPYGSGNSIASSEISNKAEIPTKVPFFRSPKSVNFGKILCGLSFGLNAAYAIKCILHEYLEQNPKLALPIVGISTALGGIAGYLLSKI